MDNTSAADYANFQENKAMNKGNLAAFAILGCAWLFYVYEYVLRVSPGVIEKQLMLDFGITATMVGTISSAYYWAYVPMQIPCGVIADKLGARRVIVLSSVACVLGCLLFAGTNSVSITMFGRFLMGAGSACAYICCTKVAAQWFSSDKFAILAGTTMFMGTLGGSFNTVFSMLVDWFDWRNAMFMCAFVGACVCIASWYCMRDFPATTKKQNQPIEAVNQWDGLRIVVKNSQNWLLGLYGCAMYLPLCAFAELWGVPYLTKMYGISATTASKACIGVFIGMGLGSIASAWLSNAVNSRKKVMSWSALGTLACFLVIFFYHNLSYSQMCVLLFVGGFMSGGQTLHFTVAKEHTPSQYSATAVGFINALVMLSAMIFQPLLGKILDMTWGGGQTADGLRIYTLDNYKTAFIAVAVAFVIGWILMQFVDETYTKEEKS